MSYREIFIEAGKKFRRVTYTPMEITDQMYVLDTVIEYFKARGDARIVVNQLESELETIKKKKPKTI
jgi:hypothetical protein